MTVTVERFTRKTTVIFRNLYPLYLHDLSAYDATVRPNRFGVIEPEPDVRTLSEQAEQQTPWLTHADLYAFLIRADGLPAGFCLVSTPPHAPADIDYLLHEFFLLHFARHQGVGALAVQAVCGLLPGSWELNVLPNNQPALRFWRKTLKPYNALETFGPTLFDEDMTIFRFTVPSVHT
ncbi:MAG: GNAT family N-acetyltransferase [Armatimonadaceae bacterium]